MKSILLNIAALLICLTAIADENQGIQLTGKDKDIAFSARNGDGVGGLLYACRGNPLEGALPQICSHRYEINPYCKIVPGTKILDVAYDIQYYYWDRDRKIGLVTDAGFFLYTQSHKYNARLILKDSIMMNDLIMTAANNNMSEYTLIQKKEDEDNMIVHYYKNDFPKPLHSTKLDIVPDVVAIHKNHFYVAGDKFEDGYSIKSYNLEDGIINTPIPLQPESFNVREMIIGKENIYLLSTPGDSMVTLTTINLNNTDVNIDVLDGESGTQVTANASDYHWGWWGDVTYPDIFYYKPGNQPDSSNYVISHGGGDTIFFNKPVDSYAPVPLAGGYYGFPYFHVAGDWKNGEIDSLHLSYWQTEIVTIPVCARPDFANQDLRHDFSSLENEADRVALIVYPNPVTNNALKIELHGLDKARSYSLEIYGYNGRLFQQVIHVNDDLYLPFSAYDPGIYHLVIRFQDGSTLSRKVVKSY